MTTMHAFKLFFARSFNFGGRSSREEFWKGILPNAIIMLILIGLLIYSSVAFNSKLNMFSIAMILILLLFCLIEIIPSISLIIRRMHDIGKSGYYIWVLLIPIIGFIWYIFLVTRPTNYYLENT